MYEFAIAAKLAEHVAHLSSARPHEILTKVGVAIGRSSGIDAKSLQLAFNELMRRSPQYITELQIEASADENGEKFVLHSAHFATLVSAVEHMMA